MLTTYRSWRIALLAVVPVLLGASMCSAQYYQQKRYEPNRPTVSPYLNLFRFNDSVIPNYQSLVRPEQQAQRFRQQQIQIDNRRQQELQQLQSSVRVLQQPRVDTELIAPTGKGSWFNVQGGSQFGNTSGFYSKAGKSDAVRAAGAAR
jgi:hypothetical protein